MRRAAALALLLCCTKPEGGVKLVYSGGAPAQAAVVKRVKPLAALAKIEGVDLAVYVPGGRKLDEVKRALSTQGRLEFSYVVEGEAASSSETIEFVEVPMNSAPVYSERMFAPARAEIEAALLGLKLPKGRVLISPEEKGFRLWVLDEKPEMSGEHIVHAEAVTDEVMGPKVMVTFDAEGKKRFDDTTARGIERRLAMILDGRVLSAPAVRERISGGSAQITLGRHPTLEEAKAMAAAIEGGGLSEPLVLAREEMYAPER